jgi:hypothetical protein
MSSISTTSSALRSRPPPSVAAPAVDNDRRLTNSIAAVNIFILFVCPSSMLSMWTGDDLHEHLATPRDVGSNAPTPQSNDLDSRVLGPMCSASKSQMEEPLLVSGFKRTEC